MITLVIVALFHAFVAFVSASVHIFNHAIAWLIFPNVARYGACMDCGDERARRAYAREHGR